MQLTFDNQKPLYVPPKGQLLKWVGNKQRFAAEISKFFPTKFKKFYEPFIGSGAVLATVAPENGFGSDAFRPLIEIWQTLKSEPNELIEWYAYYRNRLTNENRVELYNEVRASFNDNHNGKDFLYLTRSAYGGIVRFRKADGHMSTPCGVHTPISVESFAKRVNEWYPRIKNTEFRHCDYREMFEMASEGDLIYCDPPYVHSQGILYGAQEFRLEELFLSIENAKSRGVKVALSIDGSKKSGELLCDLPIPDNIFEEEIFVNVGRSMLRRFQMEGQSLETENVSDRLLITYNQ